VVAPPMPDVGFHYARKYTVMYTQKIYQRFLEQKRSKQLYDRLDIDAWLDVNRRVAGNTVDARITVQVLVEGQLEDRGTAVPGNDRRHSQEIDPDPVPPIPILFDDFLLVADPVLVPAVDGCRVVDTKNINVFNLKSSGLKLANDPTKRT